MPPAAQDGRTSARMMAVWGIQRHQRWAETVGRALAMPPQDSASSAPSFSLVLAFLWGQGHLPVPEHGSLSFAHTVPSTRAICPSTPNSACGVPPLFKVAAELAALRILLTLRPRKVIGSFLAWQKIFLHPFLAARVAFLSYISVTQAHISPLLKDCKLWICV